MATLLITGGNRGIGLGLVKVYLANEWKVLATCRDLKGAKELNNLGEKYGDKLSVISMDVNNQEQIDATVKSINDIPIDLLINNAGAVEMAKYGSGAYEKINGVPIDDPDLRKYDYQEWEHVLRTNVLGPARITGSFIENLKKPDHGIVVMMTSGLASVSNTWQAGRYAYRTSKAALNMLMRSAGEWLESYGITTVAISPGWTRTDMGGPNATNSIEESANGVYQVITKISPEDAGKFLNFDGTTLPW
ncbi:MAG: SDR family oxidoreductase [Pseudomonadota bacterium]|nr:SDR family oxidoreductase [Pseudomonadota bacterium]